MKDDQEYKVFIQVGIFSSLVDALDKVTKLDKGTIVKLESIKDGKTNLIMNGPVEN